VVQAARAYVRVLIRVPDAYLILARIESTRPGLLVLDAEGRRVDSISLLDRELTPAKLAGWLKRARTAPARERWTLRLRGGAETRRQAFLREMEKTPGVEEIRAIRRRDEVRISLAPGSLHPERLLARAFERELDPELLEPVRVTLKPVENRNGSACPSPAPSVPGAWYASAGPPARIYLPGLLLDPATIETAAPGHVADAIALDFRFTRIPKNAAGYRVAAAPLRLRGVLAVIPDIIGQRERVVVRRGEIAPDAIVEAFEMAGGTASLVQ